MSAVAWHAKRSRLLRTADSKEHPRLQAGWYAQILGENADLADWKRTLNEPFDPVALQFPDDYTVLTSCEFDGLAAADEVRSKALILIARLNGALRLTANAQPVRLGSIIEVDDEGNRHVTTFLEGFSIALGQATMTATAVLIGADGKPVPPAPPQPSDAQKWVELADKNELVAELLDHFGRADNWYDIYKTIEVAERLTGGEQGLKTLMGDRARDLKDMRTSANCHRHFRGHKPSRLFTLSESKELLAAVVRATLDSV